MPALSLASSLSILGDLANRAVQEEHAATRVITTRSSLVLQLVALEQRMGQGLDDKTTRIDEDYRYFDIGAEKNES